MASVTGLLADIKLAFSRINTSVQTKLSQYPTNKTLGLASCIMEKSEYFTLINENRSLLSAHWQEMTSDIQVNPFVFNILFSKTVQDPYIAIEELKRLFNEPAINTFKVFSIIRSLDESVASKLKIIFNVLQNVYTTENPISLIKAKAICDVFIFVFEQFNEKKTPIELIKCKAFDLHHSFGEVTLFLLNAISPSERPFRESSISKILQSGSVPITELLKCYSHCHSICSHILIIAAQRGTQVLAKGCKYAKTIEKFEFDLQFLKKWLEINPREECLVTLLAFFAAIDDTKAEYMLLLKDERVEKRSLRPVDEKDSSTWSPILLKYRFYRKLVDRESSEELDKLWHLLSFSECGIIRLLEIKDNYCGDLSGSALYLSKKLPNHPTYKFAALYSILYPLDNAKRFQKIKEEIQEILDKGELPLLFSQIDKFPSLLFYILSNPQWKEKVENCDFTSLNWRLVGLLCIDVFMVIDLFQHFLNKTAHNLCLQQEFRVFCKLAKSPQCPSVLFEVMQNNNKELAQKAEALTWLCKNIPPDIKEEIYTQKNNDGYTVLHEICKIHTHLEGQTNIIFGIEWHEVINDIITYTKARFSPFPSTLHPRLCLGFLEIDENLVSELLTEQLNPIVNLCMNLGKDSILKKILTTREWTQQNLNSYMVSCIIALNKVQYLKYFLNIAEQIPYFSFSMELVKDLEKIPVKNIFQLLRSSFVVNDYIAQIKFIGRLFIALGLEAKYGHLSTHWIQMCNSEEFTRHPEYQRVLKKYPSFRLRIELLFATYSQDKSALVNLFNLLSLKNHELESLYYFLVVQSANTELICLVFNRLSEHSKSLIALRSFEGQIELSDSSDTLDVFTQFLSGPGVNLFTENPKKYPKLVACLSRIPNISELLDRIDCESEKLISYALAEGMTDVLNALLKGDSKGKIADVLYAGPENIGSIAWFRLEIKKNIGRALLIMLGALSSRKLLGQDDLNELFYNKNNWDYKEFIAKVFSLCSPSSQKKIIASYGSEYGSTILIEIARRNNNELADVVVPLIEVTEIENLILPSEDTSLFSFIKKENRSIYKKLLPKVPKPLLQRATQSLTLSNYCCLASFGNVYVPLTSRNLFPHIIEHCVKEVFDEALLNYLSEINNVDGCFHDIKLTNSFLLDLVNIALRNSNNHVIINCLLLQLAPFFLKEQELLLVNKLKELDRETEIIFWMSIQLESVHASRYFETFRADSYLRRLMFEAGNDSITRYVRSLNLSEMDKREFLPFLPISTIATIRKSIPPQEQNTLQSKRVYFRQASYSLSEALVLVYESFVVPLLKALKEPASNANANEIRSLSMTIVNFLSGIIFDDIVAATSEVKEKLALLLPYLPRSRQAVLIPNLENNQLNNYLKTQSLDKQAEWLQYASLEQKESFLKVVGLKQPHVDLWEASSTVSETLCYTLLGNEALLTSTLKILCKALKTSEEFNKSTQTAYDEFATLVNKVIREAKELREKIKYAHPPEEFFDMITQEIMLDPVIIKDWNNVQMVVDSSTVTELSNNPEHSQKFNLHDVIPHTALKAKITEWHRTHS